MKKDAHLLSGKLCFALEVGFAVVHVTSLHLVGCADRWIGDEKG